MRSSQVSLTRPFPATTQPMWSAFQKPPTIELGPPLNIKAVAELIGCSVWTVRQTLMRKGLPYFRCSPNGRLVFYRQQVLYWIRQQQEMSNGTFGLA